MSNFGKKMRSINSQYLIGSANAQGWTPPTPRPIDFFETCKRQQRELEERERKWRASREFLVQQLDSEKQDLENYKASYDINLKEYHAEVALAARLLYHYDHPEAILVNHGAEPFDDDHEMLMRMTYL